MNPIAMQPLMIFMMLLQNMETNADDFQLLNDPNESNLTPNNLLMKFCTFQILFSKCKNTFSVNK